jgi:hypothetical protein
MLTSEKLISTPDREKTTIINTGYFTSNNVPDGIKNATHNTFSIFRKSWLLKLKLLKYPAFFGND